MFDLEFRVTVAVQGSEKILKRERKYSSVCYGFEDKWLSLHRFPDPFFYSILFYCAVNFCTDLLGDMYSKNPGF